MKKIFIFVLLLIATMGYLSYKMMYSGLIGNERLITYSVILLITFIGFGLSFYLYEKRNLKIEKIYLIIGLVSCLLYCIAIPLSKGHDETIHGYRVYEYAEGKFISDGQTVELEQGVLNTLKDKALYKNIWEQEKGFYDIKDTPKQQMESRIASYSPITYLPQITGVLVGKTITDNGLVQLYLARIFNSIVCVAMVYFAIKLIPFGKNIIGIIAMIPIVIEGFSTLSADGITIAASLLWISYILNLTYGEDKKIGVKQLAILLGIAIIVAVSKTVYITLLLLLLFIPKEKFKNLKYRIGGITLIYLIATILDVFWFMMGTTNNSGMIETTNTPIQFIIQNPILYLQKVLYTVLVRFPNMILEMFGGYLEWNENVKIPFVACIMFAMLLYCFTKKDKTKYILSKKQKVIMIIIILATILLVYTSMFMGWSALDSEYIMGVQGRYLLPVLPLILFLITRSFSEEEKVTKLISSVLILVQILALSNIILFHV